jgi:hypothetical protein
MIQNAETELGSWRVYLLQEKMKHLALFNMGGLIQDAKF